MSRHGGTLEELSFARFVCGVNLVEHPLTLKAPDRQPPKLGLKRSSDCCSPASRQVKLQLPVHLLASLTTFCPVRQNQQHHSRETLRVKVRYTSSLMRDFIHITVLCMKRSDGLLLASILKLQSDTS